MQGKGWRRCLFAFLLATSLTDVSGDLSDDNPSADSKSGNPTDDVLIDNSNESRAEDGEAEAFVDSLANIGIPGYPEDEDRRRNNLYEAVQNKPDGIDEHNPIYIRENSDPSILTGPSVNSPGYKFPVPQVEVNDAVPTQHYGHSDGIHARQNWKDDWKNDPIYVLENSGEKDNLFPEPSVNLQGYRLLKGNGKLANPTYYHENLDDYEDGSQIKNQFIKSTVREGPVHDELGFPKDPTYETVVMDNEYTYDSRNSSSTGLGSSIYKHHEFISKLIPLENHIQLNKIPGAENIIKCTNEGEIHNFWAPGFQCMVCVCLAAYGRLRPVCVSCQSCLTPLEPTTLRPTVPPYNPPSTPPPPPENVSCKPLPINVQFPSPVDPCKVCVCTETLNQWGKVDVRIHCQHNPQCVLPTTPRAHVSTPVPLPVCDKLPPNVPFPHPHDSCKICQCIMNQTPHGQIEPKIVCYTSPECQPITSTQPPVPDITDLPPLELCDRYPENVLFPHPRDQCQVCKCTLHSGLFIDRKKISCYVRPDCLPDTETTIEPVTITPEPVDVCERYPHDKHFPHPTDPCRVCKCHKNPLESRAHMNCFMKPECVPTPEPPPKPVNVTCAPLPIGKPFQHPLHPCQICSCTEHMDMYSGIEAVIECKENPQCVLPPDFTTVSPDIMNHTIVPACKNFPENVYFPHPTDACKLCKCYVVQRGPYISSEQLMSCIVRPECLSPLPTTVLPPDLEPLHLCEKHLDNVIFPDPLDQCKLCKCYRDPRYGFKRMVKCFLRPECVQPSTTEHPIPNDVCGRYPINTPFDDPNDQCRTCTCTQVNSVAPGTGLQNSPFRPQLQILCQIKPECLLPPPTTEYPDYDVCGRYPINTPFDDPNDQCRTCTCTQIGSAAPGAGLQNSPFRPQLQILCQIKPECLQPSTTEYPVPYDVCGRYPINTPFDDPNDQCRTCTCTQIGSAAPGTGLQNSPFRPQLQILCQIKPECMLTEQPEPNSFCENYPVEVPFTDPMDPCRSCVCFWNTAGSAGTASPRVKMYKCVIKPECHRPTSEPITKSPVPDVSCKPLPSGKPFQSPLNPCQICTCTETVDVYGRPDVVFKCQQNPQCVIPNDVTTVPPDSHTSPVPLPACARLPTNVEFPHPSDPCKLCKCTVQRTPWGKIEQHINCFTNSQCAIVSTTSGPWPPAPPGPLPGPSPHESCTPYIPNQPFQHPWDECQTCVCREAISSERITIEVNCYTKPSCCYESPIDTPGLPDGGVIDSRPLIDGSSSTWVNPGPEYINQVLNWKHSNENEIGTTGNTQIGYKDNLIRQSGNMIGPTGGNSIGPSGGNIISSAGDNWIKSTGSIVIGPTGGNIIGLTGKNVIGPTGGNMIGSTGSNLIGTNGGNLYGPNGGNLYRPNGAYGPNGEYGPNDLQLLKPNGNLYVPNRGNLIMRPTGAGPEQGLWKKTFHYNLRPEEVLEAKAEAKASSDGLNSNAAAFAGGYQGYSNKMRTKSGRSSDNSEDYD